MSQVVNDDIDEGIVVDEFRKGYAYYDKLLRPSLVAVSKKSDEGTGADDNAEESININIKEDSNG